MNTSQQQPNLQDLPPKNENNQPPMIQLSIQELSICVLDHYAKLRNDQLPQLHEKIPNQFIKIQKQIISIVQMRKNMQKVIENNVIYLEHTITISSLVEQNIKLQGQINQMAEIIKKLENRNMEIYVKCLTEIQNKQIFKESQIIKKGEIILMEISDLKRQFHLDNHIKIFQQMNANGCDNQSKNHNKNHHQNLDGLINDHKSKQKTLKLIHNCKFKELKLRDELLQQQEKHWYDYSRSNAQLIETLLREKEKDKNLRKKQNQKFVQLLKSKYQIDLEEENLSYSDQLLREDLCIQLNKKKVQVKEGKIEIQNLEKQKDELVKFIGILQQKIKIQMENYEKGKQNMTELWTLKLQQSKIYYEQKIKHLQLKLKEVQAQLSNFKTQKQEKIGSLQQQNKKLHQTIKTLSSKLQITEIQLSKFQQKLQNVQNQLIKMKTSHKTQLQNLSQKYKNEAELIKQSKQKVQKQLNLIIKQKIKSMEQNRQQLNTKIKQKNKQVRQKQQQLKKFIQEKNKQVQRKQQQVQSIMKQKNKKIEQNKQLNKIMKQKDKKNESNNQQFKQILKQKNQTIQENKQKISKNQQQIIKLKFLIGKYEQKVDNLLTSTYNLEKNISILQKDKTQLFIEKQQLIKNIQNLQRIIEQYKAQQIILQQKCKQKQIDNQEQLKQFYEQMRKKLVEQLQKNRMVKLNMIDSFVEKIDHLLI